jgi:tetratricopeptide (TPR) repeat protein
VFSPNNPDILLDYARTCIAQARDLDDAEETLLQCLSLDSKNMRAKALLAETSEALSNFDQAFDLYKEALNSQLYSDPYWRNRLSLGMGRVSIAVGEPGTAIAILKNALGGNDDDLEVLQTLSAAYQAAEMDDQALSVAKTALGLSPSNHGLLDWYINKTLQLDSPYEGINTLRQLLGNNPTDSVILARLGNLLLEVDEVKQATKTFVNIKNLDHATPEDLYTAAQGLIKTRKLEEAIDCLDKAINLAKNTETKLPLPKLIFTKSLAQSKQGKHEEALSTLDTSDSEISETPEIIDLKTRILHDLGRIRESKTYLEQGTISYPNHIGLRLLAISIYRNTGEPTSALIHAEYIIDEILSEDELAPELSTRGILADLFYSMLQSFRSDELLNQVHSQLPDNATSDILPYYCLKGELALHNEEEVAAADALTCAMKIDAEHPRVLALRAQITSRQGDEHTAKTIFNQALESVKNYPSLNERPSIDKERRQNILFLDSASTFIALAETSLLFQEWSATSYLLQRAMQISPHEPRSHLSYARAIILRAEFQRLCNKLNISSHAPGDSSIAEFAYRQFESSILKAAQFVLPQNSKKNIEEKIDQEPKKIISMWLARGQAVFKPSLEHAAAVGKLDSTPGIQAAHLAALRLSGNSKLARQTAFDYLGQSRARMADLTLLTQIALTIYDTNPDQALITIQGAIEVGSRRKNSILPILFSTKALIANRHEDKALELKSLQSALEGWPDEPYWLSRTADLLIAGNQKNKLKAIRYLQKAVSLEPKVVEHAMKLANIHLELGQIQEAITVLEHATHDNAGNPALWLSLAKYYACSDDHAQTIRCAKKTIELDPRLTDAYFILANVALSVDNPHKALSYANEVLQDQPKNPSALMIKYKSIKALDKSEEALAILEKLIPYYSEPIHLQLDRIELLSTLNGVEEALTAVKSLASQYPRDKQIAITLIEFLAKAGDQESAIKLSQEILTSAENETEDLVTSRLLLLLGRLLRNSGQLDQAIHYLTMAINQSPPNSAPYIELGRCYQDRRQYELALKNYQEAINIQPDNPKGYYLTGMALKESKDYENAEIMFKRASQLAPKDINIHRQLAAVTAINIVTHHPDPSTISIQA